MWKFLLKHQLIVSEQFSIFSCEIFCANNFIWGCVEGPHVWDPGQTCGGSPTIRNNRGLHFRRDRVSCLCFLYTSRVRNSFRPFRNDCRKWVLPIYVTLSQTKKLYRFFRWALHLRGKLSMFAWASLVCGNSSTSHLQSGSALPTVYLCNTSTIKSKMLRILEFFFELR